ncbi:hypothetical protein OF897_00190 [Chryseobacterium formosus]|uniref:Glycosyltransferase RgtA/B/C/D-like domain-containing protein n=1 Tax=Chryseobacterium formosus TaxID=1537363 RepID=A0ABT3XJL8_9FLAO|nr:hypothetical protein [Chryseobacterium formosus]MCX8522340.1 hypothetical protein [Chryseobacterium formosus]
MKKSLQSIKKDFVLEIFLLLVFSVFCWFFFSLSRDSYDYVNLANGIKDGKLYFSNGEYSTMWPLGYPIFIAFSSVFGIPFKISLFIINLVLFIISYKLLAKIIEGNHSDTIAILVLMIFHGIYTTAISEPLFICLIIALLYVVKNFSYSLKDCILLTLLFWFLVETKHAGIFMIPFCFLYLNGFKIDKKTFFLLLTTALLLTVLFLRFYYIGTITGENRTPNSDSLISVVNRSFDISHYFEFKRKYHPYFFIVLFLLLGTFAFYIKNYKKHPHFLLFVFLLAIFYYCYMVLLRYRTFFSGLEPRFMAPYVLFSMIFILSVFQKAKKYFVILSVILFGITMYVNIKYKFESNFSNDIFKFASFKGKEKVKNIVVDIKSSEVVANMLYSYDKTIIKDELRTVYLKNNNKDSLYYGNGSIFIIRKNSDTVQIIDLTLNKNFKNR